MRNQLIENFEKKTFKGLKKLPEFKSGDTVTVHYRIQEGNKSRVQPFEGVVIRYRKGHTDGSFTVRKIGANNIGVERVFPLCSPNIEKIQVKARGIVRRSRLYYLRDLSGKAARIRSKFGLQLKEEPEVVPELAAVPEVEDKPKKADEPAAEVKPAEEAKAPEQTETTEEPKKD